MSDDQLTEATPEETLPKAYGSVHLNERNKRRKSELPSSSKVVKRLYKAYQKTNKKGKLSLKAFARTLSSDESKSWFEHKGGSLERDGKLERLANRGETIRAHSMATKLSRRGNKSS